MFFPPRHFIWSGRLAREPARVLSNFYQQTVYHSAIVEQVYTQVNFPTGGPMPRIRFRLDSRNRNDAAGFLSSSVMTSPNVTSAAAYGASAKVVPGQVIDAGYLIGWLINPMDVLSIVEDSADGFTGEMDFAVRLLFMPGKF